jgi:Uma2 family endonuclease
MTNPAPDLPLGLAEYLAFERRSSDKHEFVDGQVYAMAGARYARNRIVANIVRQLGNTLSGGHYVTLPSDMKVRTPSSRVYYPDASVVCGPPSFSRRARGRTALETRPCSVPAHVGGISSGPAPPLIGTVRLGAGVPCR